MSAFQKVKVPKEMSKLTTQALEELIPDVGFFSVSKNEECYFINVCMAKESGGFQRVAMVWVNEKSAGLKFYNKYVMTASDQDKLCAIAKDLVIALNMLVDDNKAV